MDFINPFILYAKLFYSALHFMPQKASQKLGLDGKRIFPGTKHVYEIHPGSLEAKLVHSFEFWKPTLHSTM